MAAELVAVDLATRRRSTIWYAAGMAVYTVVIVALYPAFKDATDLDEMLADQPSLSSLFGITGSLTTPADWLSGNIYANFLPLILLFVTIGHGAATLAGEEGLGRLDLVLALPVSRRSIVTHKAVAMAVTGTVVAAVTFLASLLGRAFEVDVGVSDLATTTLGALLMALAFGLVALAIGCGTGERGRAIGITSAIPTASYLLSSLGQTVSWLQPWRPLSLFYWSVGNDQLPQGLGWDGFAVLAASVAVTLVASVTAFEHHDISS
jgi:ABC-2 type transport system permease protein